MYAGKTGVIAMKKEKMRDNTTYKTNLLCRDSDGDGVGDAMDVNQTRDLKVSLSFMSFNAVPLFPPPLAILLPSGKTENFSKNIGIPA